MEKSVLTTNEVNVFTTKSAIRLLSAVEKGEAQATPTQIKQMQDVLVNTSKKAHKIINLPCQGLCGGACGKRCKNGLY